MFCDIEFSYCNWNDHDFDWNIFDFFLKEFFINKSNIRIEVNAAEIWLRIQRQTDVSCDILSIFEIIFDLYILVWIDFEAYQWYKIIIDSEDAVQVSLKLYRFVCWLSFDAIDKFNVFVKLIVEEKDAIASTTKKFWCRCC